MVLDYKPSSNCAPGLNKAVKQSFADATFLRCQGNWAKVVGEGTEQLFRKLGSWIYVSELSFYCADHARKQGAPRWVIDGAKGPCEE
jgi:hypothetical protein